ncbi:tRNA (guanine-N(7)-)-methyltransferase non-catalytic subunit trm82 [Penicillium diatomitis]|uniref:tRNA (Guanine-N(7)-)-methyltransferase non-catalytic subunit trm82 n=1 Tax=Penicillium diatomitis TaxID=2819901 RepID=A0A9W9X4U5_9EURO|nr:tRNA (guanine-N(7)-)-methyltransferase non-catalytic subunit trm82 [Penicillium diatomitis]KAJ5483903.1 tRNA (guanine-N(7)-)-methyltransferase non-catalytic subunit trm82 [Penicillium diatomitis]
MAEFQHPFQTLTIVTRQSNGHSDVLVAAAGPYLYSYAAKSGQRLAVWPKHIDPSHTVAALPTSDVDGQAPPGKKIKLSPVEDGADNGSVPSKSDSNGSLTTWTNIPILLSTSNGKHVVAMTAEDKCIRVFEISEAGEFLQLSARNMAKKPCALDLTADDQIILCADKFGDVYSLPLIPGEYVKPKTQAKKTKPVATPLTVHSKRNLRSLEQQHLQAERAEKTQEEPEEKTVLNFEHELILGHVSMLTDIVAVTLPSTEGNHSRNYILTADRDEHIRISRGIPQAHIIEQYCLGHRSLITKLYVPPWAPHVLVSGGGEGHLLSWNWSEGRIHQTVPLDEVPEEAVVSGIWGTEVKSATGSAQVIFVAIESSPRLLCFTFESDYTLKLHSHLQLSGNVLDLVTSGPNGSLIASIDAVREQGTGGSWRTSAVSPQTLAERIQLELSSDVLSISAGQDSITESLNAAGTSNIPATLDAKQRKALDDTVYNLGNLRKRTFDD